MSYLEIVIPVVMFDWIDSIPAIQDQFKLLYIKNEKLNIGEQTIDLGYNTHNPFLLLKSLSIMQCLYFIRIFFYLFLRLMGSYQGCKTSKCLK